MSSERCLCCSVRQAAIVAANYFVLAYGAALGVTVWWIIESQGEVVVGAYILLGIYFATFMLSIILVLSLAVQRRPSVLFLWMLIICILFLPECGLNLWVCIWSLGVNTAKGLGFLIFYAARGVFNIISIVCVYFAYTAWQADKKASKRRIARAYAASSYNLAPPPPPLYLWNYNPHFPMLNYPQGVPTGPQTDYVPYSVASSIFQPAARSYFSKAASPRPRPLAAGLLVKHRVANGRAHTGEAGEEGNGEKTDERRHSKEERSDQKEPQDQASDTYRVPESVSDDRTKELIPESMPIPAIYMVDPWRLNYPPPPPFWPGSAPQMPQHFDGYTPAPLSASALAFSAPSAPKSGFHRSGVGRVPSYYYSNARMPVNPLFPQWRGGITPMRNWNTATGHYDLPKNPIPPGTVFDSKGPDVEPSFGNFIMRQRRLGDLGTFRPKALRSFDEGKSISAHIYRPAEQRRSRTGPKPAHRGETERPHRITTPIYDRSRYRAHRHQGQERHQATQTSTEHKRLHSRSPRGPSSRRTQVKHHSRERRKTTLTTLLSSSSYYRYQTTTKKRGKTGAGSGAESSTVYGHTPVRLDETTWTLM